MAFFKINRNLLPMKGHYFLWNAGTAPIVPYLSTYAKQLGFSSIIVGTIYLVLPIFGLLAKPIFGAIADRFHKQKLLFILFQILTAASFFVIQFIPEIPSVRNVQVDCDGDTVFRVVNISDTCNGIVAQSTNTSVNCEFTCPINENKLLIENLYKNWKLEEFSNPSSQPNILNFKSDIALDKKLFIEDVLYFFMSRVYTKDSSDEHVPYCDTLVSFNCEIHCNNHVLNDMIQKPTTSDAEVSSLYQFWLFFLFMILSWVGMAVVVSVGDAICFDMLGDNPSKFGHQRLWGAVGWGIFSALSGYLVDHFSRGKTEKNYTAIFYLMLVMITLNIVSGQFLKHRQRNFSTNILKDVGKLLTNVRILVFFTWCICIGLCTSMIWQFLFWHLEELASKDISCDTQAWIKTLEGLVSAVQCFCGEMPFLFLSGIILNKIGHVHAMSTVLFAFGLRFLLYSWIENPWYCLPIELLQGPTFGIFYATMASYASIVAPPGTEATVQGIVGAVFEGIGVSLGSLLGGFLLQEYGSSLAFRIFGIASIIAGVLHIIIQYIVAKIGYGQPEMKQFSPREIIYAAPNEALQMLQEDHPIYS